MSRVLNLSAPFLLGFPKGKVFDFVIKYVKKLVPDFDIPGAVTLLFSRLPSLTGGLLAALSTEDTIVSEAATDKAGELSSRRLLLTPDGPAVGRSSVSSGRLLAAAGVWTGAAFPGRLLAFCCLGFGVEVSFLAPPAAPVLFQAVPLVSPTNISPA